MWFGRELAKRSQRCKRRSKKLPSQQTLVNKSTLNKEPDSNDKKTSVKVAKPRTSPRSLKPEVAPRKLNKSPVNTSDGLDVDTTKSAPHDYYRYVVHVSVYPHVTAVLGSKNNDVLASKILIS